MEHTQLLFLAVVAGGVGAMLYHLTGSLKSHQDNTPAGQYAWWGGNLGRAEDADNIRQRELNAVHTAMGAPGLHINKYAAFGNTPTLTYS
jgi:hypothetical protein